MSRLLKTNVLRSRLAVTAMLYILQRRALRYEFPRSPWKLEMTKTIISRYDVAEHLRTTEEMAGSNCTQQGLKTHVQSQYSLQSIKPNDINSYHIKL